MLQSQWIFFTIYLFIAKMQCFMPFPCVSSSYQPVILEWICIHSKSVSINQCRLPLSIWLSYSPSYLIINLLLTISLSLSISLFFSLSLSLSLSFSLSLYFSLNFIPSFIFLRYDEAVSAYEEAQVLEPDNKGTKASLLQARNKISDLERKSSLATTGCISSPSTSFRYDHWFSFQ